MNSFRNHFQIRFKTISLPLPLTNLTWTSGKSRSFRAGMKARPVVLRKYILVSKMFLC